MEGMVGKFVVSRMIENGRKLTELCTENKLSAKYVFFKHP